MDFNEYQKQAFTTAKESSKNLNYMTLGLAGEAGEVANKVKKIIRDGKEPDIEDLKSEISDVLWYCAGLATVLGLELNDIAHYNLDKLFDRKARGVIGGSGDKR